MSERHPVPEWSDMLAAKDAEIAGLKLFNDKMFKTIQKLAMEKSASDAEIQRLKNALEDAEKNFYNIANTIDDFDYKGTPPGFDGVIIGCLEKYHNSHIKWLVKYAKEARAAITQETRHK